VTPEGECLEEGEIFTRLIERMGLMPRIPDSLVRAAKGDRAAFGMELMGFLGSNPDAARFVPSILVRTLGGELGSAHLAALWGLLQVAPSALRRNAARAGFDNGPLLGEQLFKALMDHPEGVWIGRCDEEDNLAALRTEDRRINLLIRELADWVLSIEPESEERDLTANPEFPLTLMAGRHFDYNANTIMRDPAWNGERQCCTMLMHPVDAEPLGLADGQAVRIKTEAGEEELPVEITDAARPGQVIIPHGFGLAYQGRPHGANVNRLAKNTNRDRLAATPYHRFIPCRVEPV
jgi:hypothetical protein